MKSEPYFDSTIKTRGGDYVALTKWNWDSEWALFLNISRGTINIKLTDGDLRALRDAIDKALEAQCTSPTE